ncbi:MAG: C10 family peptidase [Muribaculaceae bacterium]|nr:C10 family peptidase [Muribaculaceae bacterium]
MSIVQSFLPAALLLFLSVDLWAADVDAVGAEALAAGFLQSRSSGKLMSPGNVSLKLAYTEWSPSRPGCADYYVFNSDKGDAFVIVAGDDRVDHVLAYGEKSINMRDVPCNTRWLLDQYRDQMETLFAHSDLRLRRSSPQSDVVVEPMLTCTWNQKEPYNNECPMMYGKRCYTGCVATAMAQVMHYWKYPLVAPAVPAYTYTTTLTNQVPELLGTTFDWDNMLDDYSDNDYTSAQANAVATLMRYCGQAAKMRYGIDGSSAFLLDQLDGMKLMGYYSGATLENRYYFDDDTWDEMVRSDLMNARPVLYSGGGSETGHAFVIDGCDGILFHVNWGWGGDCDGYYTLNTMSGLSGVYHFMLHKILPETLFHKFTPQLIDVSDVGITSFTLSWIDRTPTELISDYSLHLQTYDPENETLIPINDEIEGEEGLVIHGLTQKHYTIRNLTPGGSYKYCVEAHYTDGTSKKSKIRRVTLEQGMVMDVNGDGEVSIADVNCIINAIMSNDASPRVDVNGDGEVTVADVNAVIGEIISK